MTFITRFFCFSALTMLATPSLASLPAKQDTHYIVATLSILGEGCNSQRVLLSKSPAVNGMHIKYCLQEEVNAADMGCWYQWPEAEAITPPPRLLYSISEKEQADSCTIAGIPELTINS